MSMFFGHVYVPRLTFGAELMWFPAVKQALHRKYSPRINADLIPYSVRAVICKRLSSCFAREYIEKVPFYLQAHLATS